MSTADDDEKYQNWYTIDALGTIFVIITILGSFAILKISWYISKYIRHYWHFYHCWYCSQCWNYWQGLQCWWQCWHCWKCWQCLTLSKCAWIFTLALWSNLKQSIWVFFWSNLKYITQSPTVKYGSKTEMLAHLKSLLCQLCHIWFAADCHPLLEWEKKLECSPLLPDLTPIAM